MSKHQCIQFGICPRADRGECFEINEDFRCGRDPEDPECHNKLENVVNTRRGGGGIKLGISAILLVAAGVAIFFIIRDPVKSNVSTPPKSPPTAEELLKEVWPWLR